MFQFENESYLVGLLLIPILFLLFQAAMRWQRKAIERFGERSLVERLMPDFSQRRSRLKFYLYLAAFTFLVVGLANPQVGTKLEKVQRTGIDIMVAIDVSKSMMAEDLQPNRLERAKQILSKLIDNMSDDRIGIIVFAGNAYLQMPLTSDYTAAKLFLKTISTDIVPTQGTAIGDAIELAIESFDDEEKKHKGLILISDGENHEDGALEMAERAAAENIKMFSLGIGSLEGASIPEYVNGRKAGYKRNRQGETVVSKLNQDMLKELASTANGSYIHIRGAKREIEQLLEELDSIEKRDFEDSVFTEYADQFQYFLGIALLLLLIEFFMSDRKTAWISQWKPFWSEAN